MRCFCPFIYYSCLFVFTYGLFIVVLKFRGWRVYLQDEHGTTMEATDRMINM